MWLLKRVNSCRALPIEQKREQRDERSPIYWGAITALVVLSHPLLDALTTGGLGVALWWPWSDVRIFAPLRLIPVSPIGVGFKPAGARGIGYSSHVRI